MRVTASSLRKDIYRLLDQVLETGLPLEIERKGKILRIVPQEPLDRLSKLPRREGFLVGAPDDLVHLDWSDEWKP
ncbi:MAG: type II toxin-antitoxin system Phd/YefM family antitoxin [Vulcanimicrobiota bacterium]